jgi:hypothetical protein
MLLSGLNYRKGNAAGKELFRNVAWDFGNSACRTGTYVLIANQIAITTMTTTTAAHIKGVVLFVPPLRGESLGAWL